jgi:two-component system, NtrC family, response regulator HydG
MRVVFLILKGIAMKAENLKIDELIHFSDGFIDLHGRRLIIQDLHSLGQFRRDIIKMVGLNQARRIFTRKGYFWGQADAGAMKRIFKWKNMAELIKAGPMLHILQGVVKTELNKLEIDETSGHFLMELIWHNSAEAEEHIDEMGKSDQPSCWVLVGYASGYASFCLGKSIYFIEKKCQIAGDPYCSATGKDIDSWGQEITPHLEFFHADDIEGKILKLTTQLKNMESEFAKQRKQIEEVVTRPTLASVEVRSRQFQQIMNIANRVAKFDSSILITGETGVGKEVLARHIHDISPRSNKPFVAINCAALTETLLESELFGHKAGSFTGAIKDHRGLFEEAQEGTIFLDEIGDISASLQSKLLRVLQEREILRIGETRPTKINVRIIAATNQNLEQAVNESSFRDDLYYRLKVIQIEVPALRERRDDILLLARYFTKKFAQRLDLPDLKLDSTCIDYLIEYSWPGNIREMENVIEHAAVLCTDNIIFPENLPKQITQKVQEQRNGNMSGDSLSEVELKHIDRVLKMTNGNKAEAARVLKIGLATLYRKLALL